ncbi:hypothetical protein B0O80DRAFT_440404 [Mortierella sp. GBAus27b]|nr:hypothetical protein B0O80DRAFT_440404 [Mortierella sp. GBAus27b]
MAPLRHGTFHPSTIRHPSIHPHKHTALILSGIVRIAEFIQVPMEDLGFSIEDCRNHVRYHVLDPGVPDPHRRDGTKKLLHSEAWIW